MRMVAVEWRPGSWTAYFCARCNGRINHATEKAFSDLDGPPFKSYYHERCAAEAQAEDRAKGGE